IAVYHIANQPKMRLQVNNVSTMEYRIRQAAVTTVRGHEQVERFSRYPTVRTYRREIFPCKGSRRVSLVQTINLHGIMGRRAAEPVSFSTSGNIYPSSRVSQQRSPAHGELHTECIRMSMACATCRLRAHVDNEPPPRCS